MSLFNWGNDSNSSTNTVIEQSSQAEYQPEQNYDYDNPIVIELDPCDLNDWDCQIGMKKIVRTLIFLVGGFTVMFVIGFVQTSTTGGSFYDPAGYYNP